MATCVVILLTATKMHELIEVVAPKIMDKWERLAYTMRYEPGEVKAFKKDTHDPIECCMELFSNWLTTDHGPTPKTYQTLLNHIKKVKDLAAASEAIKKELIKGRDEQYSYVAIVATHLNVATC